MQFQVSPSRENRGGIADLHLLRTLLAIHQKSWEPIFSEVMDSFIVSMYKFHNFKNPFATITNLPELYLRFRRFVLLVQTTTKKRFLSTVSSTSCWKPWRWVRFNLIPTMRDLYINSNLNPLTKFICSSRSTEFKDMLAWNISQMIMKCRIQGTFGASIFGQPKNEPKQIEQCFIQKFIFYQTVNIQIFSVKFIKSSTS